jgi:hypothetical protein
MSLRRTGMIPVEVGSQPLRILRFLERELQTLMEYAVRVRPELYVSRLSSGRSLTLSHVFGMLSVDFWSPAKKLITGRA